MKKYKINLLFICLGNIFALDETKIGLYTIYTKSHEPLFISWFLPSIPREDNFELKVLKVPQECPTACFKKFGWKKTTTRKVEMIISAIQETMGSWFVYSDVAIQ